MKKNQILTLLSTACLLALHQNASAQIIVNDTFDVGAPPTIGDDAGDPNDIAWVGAFNNTSVTIGSAAPAPGTGNYLLNDVSSGFSAIRGSLPTNTLLNIGLGQTLTLSFDFLYSAGSPDSATGFRFGLFDSTGLGTVVAAGVGTGNTTLAIFHDTTASVDQNMGSGTNGLAPFSGPSDVVSNGTMASGLDTTAVTATLSITRTNATTLSIMSTLNGGTASVTDVNDAGDSADYLTNFSGGFIVIRNGSPARDFKIDNVMVSVVPEPTTFAMLLGGLGMLIGTRRFRRARMA